MKTYIITLFLVAISFNAWSQQDIPFEKIEDDPTKVSDRIVGLTLVGPLNFSKNGSLSLMLGLDWNWKITNKVSTIGNLGRSLLVLDEGSAWDFDAGVAHTLSSKSKAKEVKVVLSASDRNYQTTSQEIREQSITYISTSGQYLKKIKARGGLIYHNSVLVSGVFSTTRDLSQLGAYGGIEFSSQYYVKSKVKDQEGVTSGLSRFYLDGMILPINRIDGVGGGLGLGTKAGFWMGLNPNKSRNKFQAFPKMYWKSEIGIRTNEGWFFMMGAGLLIYNNK